MAREVNDRNIAPTLAAAERWIHNCLIEDRSILSSNSLWTEKAVQDVRYAFVDHPDTGPDDFMTKLKKQMAPASSQAQQLMAEMLWALLLFPSNMKPNTKRQQIRDLWELSGHTLPTAGEILSDDVLKGIGSGGPGFNNYRPAEMTFLISVVAQLKSCENTKRQHLLSNYDAFVDWIETVPREGSRQFRHMLRFFAFPDQVERISSNNDRRSILAAFKVASATDLRQWTDIQLDQALLSLRTKLQSETPNETLDFYMPKLKEQWRKNRKVRTLQGELTVTVPSDQEEFDEEADAAEAKTPDVRKSMQVQAKLAEIGAIMGFRIWLPRSDRARIRELVMEKARDVFLEDLPLSYDQATLDTIEEIDVLWLKGRSIVRAFEVEHTTAIYSGLLRMADLLALQPNMDIRLHIVAPDERRDKVFREMLRPVFSLLDRGPLARSCTFLTYESVDAIRTLEYLTHTTDSIIAEYEETAEA